MKEEYFNIFRNRSGQYNLELNRPLTNDLKLSVYLRGDDGISYIVDLCIFVKMLEKGWNI
jgi:hypothetical protein